MQGADGNVLDGLGAVPRRRFLELLAVAGGAAVALPLLGCTPQQVRRLWRASGGQSLPPGYAPAYPEGVIAGDPLPYGSVLWTRLAPPAGGERLEVLWEVADSPAFTRIVAGGVARASGDHDHTVKVLAAPLRSDRWYWYRFTTGTVSSPVGRLRTAPRAGSSPDHLRFAFASCQQINDSLYVAHRAISEEPGLDFFMHLGDYIYVSDSGDVTLADYRRRWGRFKANQYLQQLQATVPLVAMWDDGEFYNGVDRTGPPERLVAAKQAFFENMPVIPPRSDPDRTYRDFAWGALADLFVLDVRAYRDPAVEAVDTRTPEGAIVFDPARTTLGMEQKHELLSWLESSRATWRFFGSPYNMGPWRVVDLDAPWPRPVGAQPNAGIYAPNEAWDDYQAERREILDFLAARGVGNNIVCSAHTHIFLATEMQPDFDDPTSPTVAFDFTSGSLTADPDLVRAGLPTPEQQTINAYRAAALGSMAINPFQKYVNFLDQGYGVVDVTPERTVVEFKGINTYAADAEPTVVARFTVPSGASAMAREIFTLGR